MTRQRRTSSDCGARETHWKGRKNLLDQALAIMQEGALYRDRVDWEAVRAQAYRRAWGARTPAGTYAAIELTLRGLLPPAPGPSPVEVS